MGLGLLVETVASAASTSLVREDVVVVVVVVSSPARLTRGSYGDSSEGGDRDEALQVGAAASSEHCFRLARKS